MWSYQLPRWEYSHLRCHSRNPWGPTTRKRDNWLNVEYVADMMIFLALPSNIQHCKYWLQSFPMFKMTKGNIHLENIAKILGEYRRAETLFNFVVPCNAFVKAWALQQVHNWCKCLPENVNSCQNIWILIQICQIRTSVDVITCEQQVNHGEDQ